MNKLTTQKRSFLILIGALLGVFASLPAQAQFTRETHCSKCVGSANCSACTNCSRCQYCKSGGTCGVCGKGSDSSYISRAKSTRSSTKSLRSTRSTKSSTRYAKASNTSTRQAKGNLDAAFPGEQFARTRTEELTQSDLNRWNYSEVRYAINEMFARHGLIFTGEIGKVFKKKSWYKPDTSDQDVVYARFSKLEKSNLDMLKAQAQQLAPKKS
jgi:hypothetical protein